MQRTATETVIETSTQTHAHRHKQMHWNGHTTKLGKSTDTQKIIRQKLTCSQADRCTHTHTSRHMEMAMQQSTRTHAHTHTSIAKQPSESSHIHKHKHTHEKRNAVEPRDANTWTQAHTQKPPSRQAQKRMHTDAITQQPPGSSRGRTHADTRKNTETATRLG